MDSKTQNQNYCNQIVTKKKITKLCNHLSINHNLRCCLDCYEISQIWPLFQPRFSAVSLGSRANAGIAPKDRRSGSKYILTYPF